MGYPDRTERTRSQLLLEDLTEEERLKLLAAEQLRLQQVEASETKDLLAERERAIKAEARRLMIDSGISPTDAINQTRQKFEKENRPQTMEWESRPTPRVLPEPAVPGKRQPLRPQIQAGPVSTKEFELNAEDKASRVFPGVEPNTPQPQAEGLKALWDSLAESTPHATGEQLTGLMRDELESLPKILSGEGARFRQDPTMGPSDPLFRMFAPQVTAGGVPDLSQAQRDFLNVQAAYQAGEDRPKIEADVRENYTVPITRRNRGDAFTVQVKPSEEQINEEILRRFDESNPELPWWATEEKEKVLADIEGNTTGGLLFAKKYPTGAVVEGPVHYIFRSALAPVNAGIAAIGSLLEDAGGVPKDRSQRPGVFQEDSLLSDIGFNVATNRSATEEIGEMWASQASLRAWAPVGYAAGFLADILMPFDFGVSKVAQSAVGGLRVSRATKALTGAADWSAAAKFAGRSLVNDVPILKKMVSGPGDIRLLVGAETGRSLVGYRVLKSALDKGDDLETALAKVGSTIGEDASFIKQARRFNSGDEALGFFAKQEDFLKHADDLNDEVRGLARLAAGDIKPGKVAIKDVARLMKVLAKVDPEIETLLKGKKGIQQMVEAIFSSKPARGKLLKQMAWEKGMTLVAKGVEKAAPKGRVGKAARMLDDATSITADSQGIARDLVMITPRTWAESGKIDGILKAAGEGDLAKLNKTVTEWDVSTPAAKLKGGRAKPVVAMDEGKMGWELTKEQSAHYNHLAEQYKKAGLITEGQFAEVTYCSEVVGGITTDSYRVLINAEIDLTAQGMQKALTEKVANQLSAPVRMEIIQPIETRSLTSSWFNRNITGYFRKFPMADVEVPLAVQQELQTLTRRVSSLDQKLRSDVAQLRAKGNPLREVYGIPADAKVSGEDAMKYLIIGDGRANDELFATVLDYYALYLKKTPQLGAIFKGDTFVRSRTYLSDEGAEAVVGYISRREELTPQNFDKTIDKFLVFVRKNLEKNPAWISPSLSGQGAKAGVKFLGEEHMPELMAATYYQVEARRAVSESLEAIMERETINLLEGHPYAGGEGWDDVTMWLSKINPEIDPRASFQALIINRARYRVTHTSGMRPTLSRGMDDLDTWESVVGDMRLGRDYWELPVPVVPEDIKPFIAEYVERADDAVEGILMRNRLASTNVSAELDELQAILLKPRDSGQTEFLRQILGRDGAEKARVKAIDDLRMGFASRSLIEDAMLSSTKIKGLQTYLEGLVDTGDTKMLMYAGMLLRRIQSTRYHVMLGWRPRFHGANTVTAPVILSSTVGTEVAVDSFKHMPAAVDTIFTGLVSPGGVRASRIVVTDAAGRSWTRGELFKVALEDGALRSQASFQMNEAMIDGALSEAKILMTPKQFKRIRKYWGDTKNAASIPLEMASVEDNLWRMSVIIDSLKKGEDLQVALQKGRVSMFDYGTLSDKERFVATRLVLFYTFQRMNITHTINNLVSHPNRFKNALMITKDTTRLLTGEDADDLMWYAPEWAQARPVLAYSEGVGKEAFYTMGPATVPVEAAVTIVDTLIAATQLDVAGVAAPLTEALSPEIKLILGEEGFDRGKPGVINPVDYALLSVLPPAMAAFTSIVGEAPVGVPPDIGESTVNGQRWTLSQPAWERYRGAKGLSITYAGFSTLLSDLVKGVGFFTDALQGRKVEAGGVSEILGVTTRTSAMTPEQARIYAIQNKFRNIVIEKRTSK